MKKYILSLSIFSCFILVSFLAVRLVDPGSLFPAPDSDTVFITQVVPGDPVLIEIETTVPDPVLIDTGEVIYIQDYAQIDTADILKDYLRQRMYTDTLVNDTSYRIVYQAAIFQNKLQHFNMQHQNLREKVIYKTQIVNYNPKLMIGGQMMFSANRFNIGPTLLYHHKRSAYEISVGLLDREYRFSYYGSLWHVKAPP